MGRGARNLGTLLHHFGRGVRRMERQIKFRAWGRIDKRMYPIAFPSWNGIVEGKIDFVNHEVIEIPQEGDDTPVLMQFTGLHDKNGKEIYEGDIVVTPRGISRQVVFLDGCFQGIYIYDSCNGNCLREWGSSLEIVGNVYENPELLPKED
jgi:hypothetical protein